MSCRNEKKQKNVTYHDTSTQHKQSQPALFVAVATADRLLSADTGDQTEEQNSPSTAQCKYVTFFESLEKEVVKGTSAGKAFAAELQRSVDLARETTQLFSGDDCDPRAAVAAALLFLKPTKTFDMGNFKEQKICCGCCRPFTWRKKWERCWPTVYVCCDKCKSEFRAGVAGCSVTVRKGTGGKGGGTKVVTQPGTAGEQYPYPTGNIWSVANRGDLKGVKGLLMFGRISSPKGRGGQSPCPAAGPGAAPIEGAGSGSDDADVGGTASLPFAGEHGQEQESMQQAESDSYASLPIPAGLRNKVGWTPLHAAAAGGHEKVVDFLLSKAVAIKCEELASQQELRLSSKSEPSNGENPPPLPFVFPSDAFSVNVNAQDSAGRTPLFEAVRKGHLAACRLLVKKGADVDARDGKKEGLLAYCKDKAVRDFLANCLAARAGGEGEGGGKLGRERGGGGGQRARSSRR